VDMPRLYRAMEAQRIMRIGEMVERMDDGLQTLGANDGPLVKEISLEKARWRTRKDSKS
jgi:hypothetical protein